MAKGHIVEGTAEYFTRKILQRTSVSRRVYTQKLKFATWLADQIGEGNLKAAVFGGDPAMMERINDLLRKWMFYRRNRLPVPTDGGN